MTFALNLSPYLSKTNLEENPLGSIFESIDFLVQKYTFQKARSERKKTCWENQYRILYIFSLKETKGNMTNRKEQILHLPCRVQYACNHQIIMKRKRSDGETDQTEIKRYSWQNLKLHNGQGIWN